MKFSERWIQDSDFAGSVGENGQSFTRTFIQNDVNGELDALPKIGEVLTAAQSRNMFANIKTYDPDNPSGAGSVIDFKPHVISIDVKMYGKFDKHQFVYTVNYGIQKPEDENIVEIITFGGEWMEINDGGTNEGPKFTTSEDRVTTAHKLWIPSATYSVTSFHSTMNAALTVEGKGPYINFVGKVLLGLDTRADDGHWLCNAPTIDQMLDRDGNIIFKRTENFTYKLIQSEAITGGVSKGGWNLVWNTNKKTFDTTDPLNYPVTDESSNWPAIMPF